jgi:hypothetical protein
MHLPAGARLTGSLTMRTAILRALLFAGAVVAVSVAIDLLMTVFYLGDPVLGRGRQFYVFRLAIHGASFVLTALGSAVGFAFLRAYSITNAHVCLLGAALGMFTLSAALMAVKTGGFLVVAVLLVVGSALVAHLGGKALGTRGAHV